MKKVKYIFLRNDDVRDRLDDELLALTEICLKHKIPLSHAVEPANVTPEVVKWLLKVKIQHPSLIEIIQHGYDHNRNNPLVKMEFGGNRSYEDQLESISKGKKLMDKYFGSNWSPVFTFPYGTFNTDTLKAVDTTGYRAISAKAGFNLKNRLKDMTGKMLNKDFLLNRKVSYHGGKRRNYSFNEYSVSANLIKKYLDSNTAVHYSYNEILEQVVLSSRHTNITGLLFHHRFHGSEIDMINELLVTLKEGYSYSTIMNLLR